MTAVVAPSRRQQILDIAATAFAAHGFSGCSVREIAEQANILSGSLYHHFSSKDEMVIEILDHYWRTLFGAYDAALERRLPPDETLVALVEASLRVAEECTAEVQILHQDWHYLQVVLPDLDANMARIEETFTAVLRDGAATGVLRADIDPRIAYRTIMGAIGWVTRWYRPGGSLPMDEIIDAQARLWMDGLRRHPTEDRAR